MNIKEVLAPSSGERIILVVLFWALLSAVLAQFLDLSLVRWEVVLGGILVVGWAVWAINYRLEQAEKELYKRQR